MPFYCDYITVADYRTTYQGSATTATGQDALILQTIKAVAREIEAGSRWYYPRIETRYFDGEGGRQIDFDTWDLMELTTFANGDGTAISGTDYDLLPYYGPPYFAVRTKATSGIVYLPDSTGNYARALGITGVGGFVKDYASCWVAQVSQTGVISASATALTSLTTGELQAGQLLKLGSTNDYAYVSAAATTTATIIRGVNGSTGISHGATDAIYVFNAGDELTYLVKTAVQAFSRLKDNPMGEMVVIPGVGRFNTPSDVRGWISREIAQMGYAQPY
jgi:hypothetical protein